MIPKWMRGRDLNGDVIEVTPSEDASQELIVIANAAQFLCTATVLHEDESEYVITPTGYTFTLDNPATNERYIFGDDAKVIEATLGEGYEEIDLNGLSTDTQRAIPGEYWPGRAFRLKEVK